MNNINNMFNLFNAFRANPMQMLQQRFNIPGNINDPNAVLNHLVNTGQVSKQQIDQINSMRNNPMLRNFFGR